MTSSTGSPVTTTTRKTVPSHRIAATTISPRTVTATTPPAYSYRQQTQRLGRSGSGIVRSQHPRHLLAYSLLSILVVLCWLPDFIVALKDVSVTIPQAVKRGSNAMLTCNYDMENDTLYSVKWYKGRREFYRYTPKENPAMKVFLTQSGLNVERNLSNQSHVVLLAVPLNISGKFTCEISVEAPSFQTAMVSGEMEVVELPEEQASVTGIQPRYRIGDLVDGNCSIKYSKPAANLTWTINGIVVPPHHIKTYQIEKYEETNLESVMSAIHFMVTTQHFIKGQMRLKCTASIFDIFREEIESVIEEDRPRIMASGRSYDAHSYPHDDNGGGYEDHNESYLTYFSAPKSAASPRARAPFSFIFHNLHKLLQHLPRITLQKIKNHICFTLATFIIDIERYYEKITHSDMTTYWLKVWQQWQRQLQQQQQLIKLITVMVVLLKIHQLLNRGWQWGWQVGIEVANKTITKKCCNCKGSMMKVQSKQEEEARERAMTTNTLLTSSQDLLEQQQAQLLQDSEMHWDDCYLGEREPDEGAMAADAATAFGPLHADCQFGMEQCLAANQNVINEKVWHKHENISATSTIAAVDDYQQQMSQTLDGKPSSTTTPTASLASPSRPFATVIVSPDTYRETQEVDEEGHAAEYAHDSFPLCDDGAAIDATKSNNANYMSRDQTLLMTSSSINTTCPNRRTPTLESTTARKTKSSVAKATTQSPSTDLAVTLAEARTVASSASLTSTSPFALSPAHEAFTSFLSKDNNCLMAFIGELLLHQC